jgi:hypothetical protein
VTHTATGLNNAWAKAIKGEPTAAEKADLARRRKEDFDFMVLCASKNNMSFYRLFRDTSLDKEPK